jgi:hypothetical protein
MILLVNSRRGYSYWLIPSMAYFCCCSRDIIEAPSVALYAFKNVSKVVQCAFNIGRELLYFVMKARRAT